jgi:hypothetical protein
MGAFGDPHSVVGVVVWQMVSGLGECQLCAVPRSYADPFLVSPLSMGDPCVLSAIPGALCRLEFIELPLFRDPSPPLVAGAVPYALGTKYSRDAFHATARPNPQSPGRQPIRRSVTRSNSSRFILPQGPVPPSTPATFNASHRVAPAPPSPLSSRPKRSGAEGSAVSLSVAANLMVEKPFNA